MQENNMNETKSGCEAIKPPQKKENAMPKNDERCFGGLNADQKKEAGKNQKKDTSCCSCSCALIISILIGVARAGGGLFYSTE